MFGSRAVGPGSDYGRAIWSTQGGYGPVGSCGRAMGLGDQFGLGFDMPRCFWTCLDVSGNLQDPTGAIWTVDCNRWPRSVPKGCLEGMCSFAHAPWFSI